MKNFVGDDKYDDTLCVCFMALIYTVVWFGFDSDKYGDM